MRRQHPKDCEASIEIVRLAIAPYDEQNPLRGYASLDGMTEGINKAISELDRSDCPYASTLICSLRAVCDRILEVEYIAKKTLDLVHVVHERHPRATPQ